MERNLNANLLIYERKDIESIPEAEAPPLPTSIDMRIPSTPPKRSRRSIQKRVVSVPIKDVEGSRLKGDTAPPSDSWAWRKYGQKPIKGSPYPRGYYRCSSSKGCPARKQVERSRDDPTTIVISYTCEHNHTWPAPRNGHRHKPKPEPEPEPENEERFADLGLGEIETASSLLVTATPADEFAWFGEMETTSSTILESPMFSERRSAGDTSSEDVEMFSPMREEDESLFADLGELPECSVVFRHRNVGPQVEIF